MKKSNQNLWPYTPKISILTAVSLLVILLVLIALLRSFTNWPPDDYTTPVVTGVLIISLFPVLLVILDVIIARGGSIGYGDLKIDFSKVQQSGNAGFIVPANIGTHGNPVNESDIVNILEILQQTSSNSVAIIDLEDGEAWWETRLLVLLSGAQRLRHPDKIVFVATQGGKTETFIGWGKPEDLLRILLNKNPKYSFSYHFAKAISNQWKLVQPVRNITPQNPVMPVAYPWMPPESVYQLWTVFNSRTGLPIELSEEQILQNELTNAIERPEGGKSISSIRALDLFDSVLNRNCIEQNQSSEEQSKAFFADDNPVIALTQNGKYISLISRFAIYNEMLKNKND